MNKQKGQYKPTSYYVDCSVETMANTMRPLSVPGLDGMLFGNAANNYLACAAALCGTGSDSADKGDSPCYLSIGTLLGIP